MKTEYLIWLAVIVTLIIQGILWVVKSSRQRKKREKRAARLKEFGPKVPLFSLPNENLISKFKESTGVMWYRSEDDVVRCLFGGKGATNLMEGNIGPIEFLTFDYEYQEHEHSDDKGFTFSGTAILLQSDQLNLPPFRWIQSSRTGTRGVQPKAPPKGEEGPKQCPQCGNWDTRWAYIEDGGMGHWCPHCKRSFSKINEEIVRKMFESMSTADHPGWTGIGSNTQLLLHRGSTVAAEKMQEFMEEALTIFEKFQSASRNLNAHA